MVAQPKPAAIPVQRPVAVQYNPPQKVASPPSNQMMAYNPPAAINYPTNANAPAPQQNINRYQQEVVRQLAPMSDKDRAKYAKEKDLEDRRQRAL